MTTIVLAMLFREAAEVADGLVSSCGNPTGIRSIFPKRPQADVTNAHHLIIVDTDVV